MVAVGSPPRSMTSPSWLVLFSIPRTDFFYCWVGLKYNYRTLSYHKDMCTIIEPLGLSNHVSHCCGS